MSFSTPQAGIVDFLARLQRSLTCVLEQVPLPFRPRLSVAPNDAHLITLNDGSPQSISSNLSGPALLLTVYVRPVENESGYRIEITGYSYHLGVRQRGEYREIPAWQWDQRGTSPIVYPHLHVSAASDTVPGGLSRLHIPTNRVLVEDILEFAIVDLGIPPRRDDWRAIFSDNRDAL